MGVSLEASFFLKYQINVAKIQNSLDEQDSGSNLSIDTSQDHSLTEGRIMSRMRRAHIRVTPFHLTFEKSFFDTLYIRSTGSGGGIGYVSSL